MAENPRLPDYVAPSESLSRPSATSINRTQGFSDGGENRQSTLTITGLGRRIPVVYGEARVPGYHLVAPRIHNTELLMAVAWSWGECEGVQTMYINGEAVPAGVTLTHYTGTDAQAADPTLSAAIPGFGDTFAGVAYTVISVPTGTVSGFPNTAQIEAVFRGRLLFDPRDSTTAYSNNPGLAIADFVQSTDYGPGLTVSGVADVADRCDELVSGSEVRSQIGLSIRGGQRLDNWLDVLSAYAECLWSYDGDGVLIVPDAPSGFARDSTATYWDADGVLQTAAIDEPRWDHDPITGERLGLLVEGQITNHITDSEDFAQWSNVNMSITPGATTGPDGKQSASLLLPDATNAEHFVALSPSYSSFEAVSTHSIYAKPNGYKYARVRPAHFDEASATTETTFNIETGEVVSTDDTYGIATHVEKLPDGWLRIAVTIDLKNSDNVEFRFQINNDSNNGSYSGDGVSGVYVFGAQLEFKEHPTSYIKTDGAKVTRAADEDDGRLAAIFWDDVVEGSFQFQGQSLDSAPTVVTINYRPSTGTAEQWRDEPKEVRLPEVDSGEAPEIRSDVSMPGIQRESEAERKAITRLRRLQFPAKYAWQMHDSGVKFKRGDIVQLPPQRGLEGWLVRILSVEMIRTTGIYQITAEHYDPAIYPDDYTPTSETTIPVGGIVTYSGNTAPSGWAFWTDADGRLLRGAGTESAGATGGDNTVSISGTTSDAGGHSGDQDMTILDNTITIGGDAARFNNIDEPDHNHGFSGSTETEPLYRQTRFIEKTGSPGQLPQGGGVFSGGELIAAALSEATSHIGRVVKAGASHDTGGQDYSKTASVSLVDAGEHNHQGSKDYIEESGTQFSSPQYTSVDAMLHDHPGSTVSVSFDIARKRIAHYIATASSDIIPGCIILLKPGVSIPSGWHVCDGNNGTIDLQDFFPQLSSANDANTTVGSNSGASWSGTTEPDGEHNHNGGSVSNTKPKQVIGHVSDVPDHDHTMSGSDASWLPEYYVVRFIEYTGVA